MQKETFKRRISQLFIQPTWLDRPIHTALLRNTVGHSDDVTDRDMFTVGPGNAVYSRQFALGVC
jgi:hypothetical protein